MSPPTRPSSHQIRDAARILGMPVDAVRRAVDDYFNDPPPVGRPRREIDGAAVAAALDGRSVRQAARILSVPESTLRAYFNRDKK